MIRTRIAPAPTGPFHIGNARTALYNYIFAKHAGGVFVLRIEDTDQARSRAEYEREIFSSLLWLGIQPDEDPVQGGSYGPYRQSQRTSRHREAIERLIESGQAYYCPHSDSDLDQERQKQLEAKQSPIHRCSARDASPSPNTRGIIRFKMPVGQNITFTDFIRGEISFASDLIGDFSIAKDLKSPLYNLAAAVDDQDMKISHVIRGEDHISNTPKQMLIQQTLGFETPVYAHLPLILGPDRSKLSARHGATAMDEFRKQGYLPEAMVNLMALLGWNPGQDREIFSMEELIKKFDLSRVQKSGAVFNLDKLDWINGEYIREKTTQELVELCRPHLPASPQDYLEKIVRLEQPRLKKITEIGDRTNYFFRQPEYQKELLGWKNMSGQEIIASLERSEKIISDLKSPISKQNIEETFLNEIGSQDKGKTLWPLRSALTGKSASPGPFEIIAILGREKTLQRLKTAKQKLTGA